MCDTSNNEKQILYIYRPYITIKGQRIYAKAYGKKAFKIPVR